MRNLLIFFVALFLSGKSYGITSGKETRNVLLINSYSVGYAWTDSLTSGIISSLKSNPEISLHIEYLDSKQFGQSKFEIEKNHIQGKYSGITFDGILVTDNDALDFALQFDQDLFPDIPVVFAGISNPQDYSLDGSRYYGFKETAGSDKVLDMVRQILPKARRLLVVTDLSTTGKIYREEYSELSTRMGDFRVFFPEVVDVDTICRMVSSKTEYDAIYYLGINQDKSGARVDFIPMLSKITRLANVPVLTNDPRFLGEGVVGGVYQSGKKHGAAAAGLLLQLMDNTSAKPATRVGTLGYDYFFDWQMLQKYKISLSRTPEGSQVHNQPANRNGKYFVALIGILAFLVFIVLFLYRILRKAKKNEGKIKRQYDKIQHQKVQLEDTHKQLRGVVSQLEETNSCLMKTNIDLLEAKKKAEESDNLKSAFLANVSHEIRTPLNSIVGFSSLLSEVDLDFETRDSYIKLIESNTESLLVLIDEIIDLSKIEAQQLTIKKQDFSIDILMAEVFQIFNHGQKGSRVELRMSRISDSSELFVYSDRIRVKQVFINLLSNALKFTESGFIEFGYHEAGNHEIQLYVKDSGIGIKEEYHQLVFERFRKLNNDGNKVYRGTGLGLSITKKLVELLGGQIWIDSEPKVGTVFFYTLQDLELKSNFK